jgi:hypothetical protein
VNEGVIGIPERIETTRSDDQGRVIFARHQFYGKDVGYVVGGGAMDGALDEIDVALGAAIAAVLCALARFCWCARRRRRPPENHASHPVTSGLLASAFVYQLIIIALMTTQFVAFVAFIILMTLLNAVLAAIATSTVAFVKRLTLAVRRLRCT